jgi:signal transduction histidine kinase
LVQVVSDWCEQELKVLTDISVTGLALLDGDLRFMAVNPAGCSILGCSESDLLGCPSPFPLSDMEPTRLKPTSGATAPAARLKWDRPVGECRELEYRLARLSDPRHAVYAVAFHDATDSRRDRRRLTAIASAASSVATAGSLRTMMDAVAREVATAVGRSAAVTIVLLEADSGELRVIGSAGFANVAEFAARFTESGRRGAEILTFEAMRSRKAVVVPHRKVAMMADPAWAPLHDILGGPDWDSFVAVPLIVGDRVLGVLTVLFPPGDDPVASTVEFLEAMADQAAVAVDYASLLERSKSQARLDERQRLAWDLHDSAVQQVFAMRMQAKALTAMVRDAESIERVKVQLIADELITSSQAVLVDLRDLIFELRPAELTQHGLVPAIEAHLERVEDRTGLHLTFQAARIPQLRYDAAEDIYRIVQEALQNVVKHAQADNVLVRLAMIDSNGHGLTVVVEDDGIGIGSEPSPRSAFGLRSIRERADRWEGVVKVGPVDPRGTRVQVTLNGVPADGGDIL